MEEHPSIITTMMYKGLDFDDVVIFFDVERIAWDVTTCCDVYLCLIQEIYVSITRENRHVVILVQRQVSSMHAFFDELGCDFDIY